MHNVCNKVGTFNKALLFCRNAGLPNQSLKVRNKVTHFRIHNRINLIQLSPYVLNRNLRLLHILLENVLAHKKNQQNNCGSKNASSLIGHCLIYKIPHTVSFYTMPLLFVPDNSFFHQFNTPF